MNYLILNYIYKLCVDERKEYIPLPSVRWFALKFQISANDVVRTLNFWKEQNIIITKQGSKSYVIRKFFLNIFKSDTFTMFGNNIARKIVSQKVKKKNGKFEYQFTREFIKDQEIVSLSIDFIYALTPLNINLDNGVDSFISQNIKGKKTVFKKMQVIDITNMKEYQQINSQFCALVETSVFNNKHQLVSHSFSITPIKYYQNFQVEMML